MKINNIFEPAIKGVKVIHFERFLDKRGYFSETFRDTDFLQNKLGVFPNGILQTNESYSRRNVLRGLHFQWNNPMGKLVRTISGHMVDLILDLLSAGMLETEIIEDYPALESKDIKACLAFASQLTKVKTVQRIVA